MTHIPLAWSERAANKIKMYFFKVVPHRLPARSLMAERDSDAQHQKAASSPRRPIRSFNKAMEEVRVARMPIWGVKY